jgi:hypothetical protein
LFTVIALLCLTLTTFDSVHAQAGKPGVRTYEGCREAGLKRGYSNMGRKGGRSGIDLFIDACMRGKK